MPNIPGAHDFMVHGIKNDSSTVNYGPFPTLHEAQSFGDDAKASGEIDSFTISYTNSQGNSVPYEQV